MPNAPEPTPAHSRSERHGAADGRVVWLPKLIRRAAWFVCVVIWLLPSAARAQADVEPKRVLVLYWYNKDYSWNVNFDREFQAALQSAPAGPFEYYPEYLESDRFPGERQARLLHEHLRQKYADRPIDVIVATSDASLNFLLKYRADLFPQAPIVFTATRHPTAEQLAAGPGMTGLIILTEHRQTVDLALRLHPDTKHIFIVSGTLEHDKRLEKLAREQLRGYESRVGIGYLTDLRPEELIEKTKALPENSLVLYVWQQARSEQGRVLETQEILASFAPSVRVPIYGMTNVYIGKGAVGGYINLAEMTGAKAGEIATRVANGARANGIPVESAPLVPIFDWRELRRWGISEDLLPPGSIVRFKEPSFWDQYRWRIIGVISLCLVEALLIFALLAQRARRSRAEEGLRVSVHSLGERVKELTALHHAARLLQDESRSVPELLREIVELLPPAWQYPEVTAARITFGDMEFKTDNYAQSRWSQSAEFEAAGVRGAVEVVYLEERPAEYAGPFMLEERNLIESLAEMLCSALDRRHARDALGESEERFRQLTDNVREVFWLNTPDDSNQVLYVSPAYESVWGRTRESLYREPDSFFDAVHADDHARVEETIRTGRERGYDHEYRIVRPDGSVRWIWDRGFPIKDRGGRVYRIAGIAEDITERKEAEELLIASREQLRALSESLRRAKEEEGIRIARELHDELGSALTSVKWSLLELNKASAGDGGPVGGAGAREKIAEMVGLVDSTINTVRRISSELRPGVLEELGLVAAIEWHAQQFEEHTGIVCRFDSPVENVGLNREQATAVFRIFQEAMTNILRHAEAKKVNVIMEEEGEFVLEIKDNGRGITEGERSGRRSLGLLGMRERAHSVGGKVEINGVAGKGTVVIVRLPVRRDAAR